MWKWLWTLLTVGYVVACTLGVALPPWIAGVVVALTGMMIAHSAIEQRAQTFSPTKKPRRGLILEQRWYDGREHYNAQCDVLKRAEEQNQRFLAGDPKGFYGDFPVGAEFMRPEYVMFEKAQPSSGTTDSVPSQDDFKAWKKWTHDRKIGGDGRDIIWSRIVNELLRIEHLRSQTYPGAQDQAEILAIQRWLKQQARTRSYTVEELLHDTELWVCQATNGDASISKTVKAFFKRAEEVDSVGQSFSWDQIREQLRQHRGGG